MVPASRPCCSTWRRRALRRPCACRTRSRRRLRRRVRLDPAAVAATLRPRSLLESWRLLPSARRRVRLDEPAVAVVAAAADVGHGRGRRSRWSPSPMPICCSGYSDARLEIVDRFTLFLVTRLAQPRASSESSTASCPRAQDLDALEAKSDLHHGELTAPWPSRARRRPATLRFRSARSSPTASPGTGAGNRLPRPLRYSYPTLIERVHGWPALAAPASRPAIPWR